MTRRSRPIGNTPAVGVLTPPNERRSRSSVLQHVGGGVGMAVVVPEGELGRRESRDADTVCGDSVCGDSRWSESCSASSPGAGGSDGLESNPASVAAGHQRDVDEGKVSVQGEEGTRHGQQQAEAEDRSGARENGHGGHHDGDLVRAPRRTGSTDPWPARRRARARASWPPSRCLSSRRCSASLPPRSAS